MLNQTKPRQAKAMSVSNTFVPHHIDCTGAGTGTVASVLSPEVIVAAVAFAKAGIGADLQMFHAFKRAISVPIAPISPIACTK